MFTLDQFSLIKPDMEQIVISDRKKFSRALDIVEKFIIDNSMIIGDQTGINLMMEYSRSKDDYEYEVFSENAYKLSVDLANMIYDAHKKEDPEHRIVLLRNIGTMYQIQISNRILIYIHDITNSKYAIRDIIIPSKVSLFDTGREALVLPPEIQLIDIYHTLYSPHRASTWEASLEQENTLRDWMKSRFSIIGGDDKVTPAIRDDIVTLLTKFISNSNIILLGEHALEYMKLQNAESKIIQVISSEPDRDYVKISKLIEKHYPSLSVSKITKKLNIIKDSRLTRTAIKIGVEKKEIMYIYNSAEYELVPYVPGIIKIGNPYVLIRFLLIDVWIVRLTKLAGGVNEKYASVRTESILKRISRLWDNMKGTYFEPHYIGQYIDEVIDDKIKNRFRKRMPDYYPELAH